MTPASSDRQSLPARVIAINFAAFALSFAVWVMFGPTIRMIAKELAISLSAATLIKTIPILTGSVLRIPAGILTDRLGARSMFPALMILSGMATYGVTFGRSSAELIAGALVMGLAGVTFVVGVESVCSWTPQKDRGFALGIYGAGNIGTAITTFGLPLMAASLGWRGAFRVYALVMIVAGAFYGLAIRNAPRDHPPFTFAGLIAPLRDVRTWQLGLYYMATFGVFVAFTLTITDIYVDAYGMTLARAGSYATIFTITAGLCRIPGGKLADRFGARPTLRVSLLSVTAFLAIVACGPPFAVTAAVVFVFGVALGIGMAAVFRYIPDYFPDSVGAVGGVVGALGGLGGFFLPQVGAALKTVVGSPFVQVVPLAAIALVSLCLQSLVRPAGSAPESSATSLAALAALLQDNPNHPSSAAKKQPVENLEK